jgi:hypothetical protein
MVTFTLIELNKLFYIKRIVGLFLVLCVLIDSKNFRLYFFTYFIFFYVQHYFFKTYKKIGNINIGSNKIESIFHNTNHDVLIIDSNLKIKLENIGHKGSLNNIEVLFGATRYSTAQNSRLIGRDGIGSIYIEQNGKKLKYNILYEKDCDEELIRLKSDIEANGGNIVILRNYIDIFKSRLKLKF